MSMQSKRSANPMASRLMPPAVEFEQQAQELAYFKQNTAVSKNKNKNARERRKSRQLQKFNSPLLYHNNDSTPIKADTNLDTSSGGVFQVFTTAQLKYGKQESETPKL